MAHSKKLAFLSSLLFVGGIAGGCDVDVEIGESETANETKGESTDPGETTESEGATGGESSETGATTGAAETTGTGETTGGETGDPDQCDPLVQDCPDGEGCYSGPDGGFTCSPAGSAGEGETCEFINECEPGLACTVEGCVPFCDLADAGACGGGECAPFDEDAGVGVCIGGEPGDCSGPGQVQVGEQCLDTCEPLAQNCDEGLGCFYSGEPNEFVCVVEGAAGQGEVCEFVNSCLAGLACINGSALPGDPSPGGCSAYCDLDGPEACPDALVCTLLPEFNRVPGAENVGVCANE